MRTSVAVLPFHWPDFTQQSARASRICANSWTILSRSFGKELLLHSEAWIRRLWPVLTISSSYWTTLFTSSNLGQEKLLRKSLTGGRQPPYCRVCFNCWNIPP